MGQITKATIKMIRSYVSRGEVPPLTAHEVDQLATAWERQAVASAKPHSIDEDAYVIDRLSKILAEIAVIVRGPEPVGHRHGYADLPERVAALKAGSQPRLPGPTEMVVCPICGNKRCPHATGPQNPCTGSNEPGQKGSSFEACAAPAAEPEQAGDTFKMCAVADSNYAAGMLLGWNLCVANDEDTLSRIRSDRMRAAAEAVRAANEQKAASATNTAPVIVAYRIARTGEYPGTAWIDGAPAPCMTGREVFGDGYVQLAYAAPAAAQAQSAVQFGPREHQSPEKFRAAPACNQELATLQAALLDPKTVHTNMLAGKIAKPTFDMIAHLWGEEATRQWIEQRIAQLRREVGQS